MRAVYKKVLLKLSGEALGNGSGKSYDAGFLERLSAEVKKAVDLGVSLAIVIGGGNIWRGARQGDMKIDRVRADHIGMLATVMNSLVVQDCLLGVGVEAKVYSAVTMTQICEPYSQYKAREDMKSGVVVIVACGVGYPFFSTDTGMMLRAAELQCEVVLAAKNIDGVYDKDPKKHADAKKYDTITYDQSLKNGLCAIDASASAIGAENGIDTIVFALSDIENITRVLTGEKIGTKITG